GCRKPSSGGTSSHDPGEVYRTSCSAAQGTPSGMVCAVRAPCEQARSVACMPDCKRMPLDVTFLGSGDAFGSGGRLQACIALRWDGQHVLLDCGASSLIGLRRGGLEPTSVDTILISHLH